MKKLVLSILLLVLFQPICHAALQSDTAWAVDAAGASTNGGCYDTGGAGTDYTDTETTPILSATDLAQTLSSTTLTSAAGGFTSAMVDNCIQITGAGTGPFTLGFYEITAFTNATTVTIDRTACSTANCSGGTGAVGGAITSIDKAIDNITPGNTIWVKAGTYSEIVSISVANTAGNRTVVEGFNATRGDDPTGANRPVINGGSVRANCITGAGDGYLFKNFVCQNATGDSLVAGSSTAYYNIRATSNGTGADCDTCFLYNCELDSNTADGYGDTTTATPWFYFVYSHDNTGNGFEKSNSGGSLGHNFFSIADTNTADGFATSGNDFNAFGCVSYGNTGAATDGFTWSESDTGNTGEIINNVAVSNGNYGFNRAATNVSYPRIFDFNLYNGNATGGLNNVTAGDNDSASAPSFTNAAGGDFTVQSGSPLIGAGFLQTIPGATGDYQWNIGVDQDDNTAGGSGGGTSHTFVGN